LAVTIKVVRANLLKHPVRNIILIALGCTLLLGLVVCESIFGYYYFQYRHIVDERLQRPLFEQTAKIYAAPKELRVGQKLTPRAVALVLRNAGYSSDEDTDRSRMGTYALNDASITIQPGPQSYHSEQGATVSFDKGMVSKISGEGGQALDAYELEPQLITGLSEGQNRTKRRLVTFNELPPNLVNAVTSIEDRRFFEHGGVDYFRLLGALRDDLRLGRRREGGSTLTMQLARGFFLTPEKKLKRKIIEIAITFQLENRFNKQQIFQIYANEIPLGQQGSFAINGFGQAAQTYFGKDVRQLDLAQGAMLAGMIQHPSFLNPYRHPDRVMQRRNMVLDAMVETGKITKDGAQRAKAEPLNLAPINIDAGEAPYFVDLVRDRLVQRMGDTDFNHAGLRIYTSLDPDLQRVAAEAVTQGMKGVDEQVEKLHARRVKAGDDSPIVYPQVAMVALNPHTGQVLALVGGRNYGISQLNHAVAHRPTGSVFKPFVYAAAFNTSLAGTILTQPAVVPPASEENVSASLPSPNSVSADPAPPDPGRQSGVFTAVTLLNNDPSTYEGGYTPSNYHNDKRFAGQITARTALQWSENNATVTLADMVGYNNVAALARDAGVKSARGTPAVALGAYDATPLDMAGAYTVFANGGVKIDPWLVASVRSANGDVLNDYPPDSKPILDPRVAYLTLSLMENVINSGTAGRVRSEGFTAPAAGKTGTSHDAWFAGFTSNLLCVVWIGNDDYTDIKLDGGKVAAPIWAEFMKHAVQMPEYSDTRQFPAPDGISIVRLDKVTNLLADTSCPTDYDVAFLDGTAPTQTCDQGAGDQRNLFQKIFGIGKEASVAPGTPVNGLPPLPAPPVGSQAAAATAQPGAAPPPPDQQQKKKKGFFSRIFGGKADNDNKQQTLPDASQPH
jgi:penicillin-binding protein 1B